MISLQCTRLRADLDAEAEGWLAAARQERLREHLARCPGCRARLARARHSGALAGAALRALPEPPPAAAERLAGRIREGIAAIGAPGMDPKSAPPARRPRLRPLAVPLAAAVLLLTAAAFLWRPHAHAPAAWETPRLAASGPVRVERGGGRPAPLTDLRPGDRVAVPEGASLAVRFADGTELAFSEGSGAAFAGAANEGRPRQVTLSHGELSAHVTRGEAFAVETPAATASVLGTRFRVRAEPGRTRLWVSEGRVRLSNSRGETAVTAGGTAVAIAGAAPVPASGSGSGRLAVAPGTGSPAATGGRASGSPSEAGARPPRWNVPGGPASHRPAGPPAHAFRQNEAGPARRAATGEARRERSMKGHTMGRMRQAAVAVAVGAGLAAGTAPQPAAGAAWEVQSTLKIGRGVFVGVAFSGDGRRVATTSSDGMVILWDAQSGKRMREFVGHVGEAKAVAFSPDGRLLASGGADKKIILWDLATAQPVRTLTGHTSDVNSVAFSPDGRFLASGSDDKTAMVWEIMTGRMLLKLQGHRDVVCGVAYSPDTTLLATASDDHQVILWDLATGQNIAVLQGHQKEATGVAFSPDGRFLASSSEDKTAIIWDVQTRRQVHKLAGHTNGVFAVAFSADGKLVVTGAADNTVVVWDAATGQVRSRLVRQWRDVVAVALTPDARTLAAASEDGTARVWRFSETADPAQEGIAGLLAELPQAVREAIGREFGENLEGVELGRRARDYEMVTTARRGAQGVILSIGEDGAILRRDEPIEPARLPTTVADAAQREFRGAAVTRAVKVTTRSGKIVYEVVAPVNGREITLGIDEEGKPVSR